MKSAQRFMRIGIAFASLGALAFIIVGAMFHWAWAGFDRPLYDWMQLLIIPVALALIAVWFNRIERKSEQALASDNQQEAALQSYLDRISELLLEKKLRDSKPSDEVRNVARVRTLTVLYQLNTRRTNYLLTFLRESGLITADTNTSIVTLSKADLSHIDLHSVDLHGLDLSGTNFSGANLSGAYINKANLSRTVFTQALLSKALLIGTNFNGTMFFGANLSGANFNLAKFNSEAGLSARLSKADLSKAYLKGATIDKLSLDEIFVAKEQIETINIISP